MADILPLFGRLRINEPLKYVLYVGGIVLIGSLFLDVKVIDQAALQLAAFWVVVITLFVWIIRWIIEKAIDFLSESDSKDHDGLVKLLVFFYFFATIGGLIVAWFFVVRIL